jgi:hypothetical protein
MSETARLHRRRPSTSTVARGEIVDEEALADALQRDHLRGAALDVYVGEFERPPTVRLWSDRRVLITPHVGEVGSTVGSSQIFSRLFSRFTGITGLFDRDAFRQVAGLVDVGALEDGDVVGEELDRDRVD